MTTPEPPVLDGWELTGRISPRRLVRAAAVDAAGRPVNAYPLVHPISGLRPRVPWAVHLTDRAGHFRLLCADLDAKPSPTAAALDADRLSGLLTELAVPHLVCESGPTGGRHVWVALAEPIPADLVGVLARLLKGWLPTLDTAPLLNPATGCVRPPGAPHRLGGASRPLAGTLAALTYLTPLLGGWLADRVLGSWRTLLLGSVVLTTGYATLIHHSVVALYAAVALLTLGSGLFKPNIAACIGSLFSRRDDPCRSAAFGAFNACINLAAGTAPLIIGAIRSRVDWPVVFGACALSALVCLLTLARTGDTSAQRPPSSGLSMRPGSRSSGAVALAVLCVPAIAFSAIYGQSLGTLSFWSRGRVDLTLGGLLGTPINPAATCSLIPLLAIVLSPTIEPLRRFLGRLSVMRSASSELRLSLLLAAYFAPSSR